MNKFEYRIVYDNYYKKYHGQCRSTTFNSRDPWENVPRFIPSGTFFIMSDEWYGYDSRQEAVDAIENHMKKTDENRYTYEDYENTIQNKT